MYTTQGERAGGGHLRRRQGGVLGVRTKAEAPLCFPPPASRHIIRGADVEGMSWKERLAGINRKRDTADGHGGETCKHQRRHGCGMKETGEQHV